MIYNFAKKQVSLAVTLGILLFFSICLSFTYGYWQITRTQKDVNEIVAACLDLDLIDEQGSFGLDKAWPISDEEGSALTGYTFTVKNNCDMPVNYIVGLNSLETENANYLDYANLKIKIDDKTPTIYSEYNGYEYPGVRDSKLISRETLAGNGTNTHNIKIWIDKDAPVTNQNKEFRGQVFITGGQGVPSYEDCLAITSDGTVVSYDYSCGQHVVIPAKVNGIEIKSINNYSFVRGEVTDVMINTDEGEKFYLIYHDISKKEHFDTYIADIYGIEKDEIESLFTKVFYGFNELNSYVFPEGDYIESYSYYWDSETEEYIVDMHTDMLSLDLREAVYLENINEYLFANNTNIISSLIFPKNSTSISNIFRDAKIKELVIPASIKTIKSSAFEQSYIDSFKFENTKENPSQLTTIESHAFYNSNVSGKLIIPASVEYIGIQAFSRNNIDTLIFEDTEEHPSQLNTIGNYAFQENNISNEIIIPSSVISIGSNAFIENQIRQLTFQNTQTNPSKLSSIGEKAFSSNSIADKLVIPASVETIGESAFQNNEISALEFENAEGNPSKLKGINKFVFYNNKISGELIIPNSVEFIEYQAFSRNIINSLKIYDPADSPSKLEYIRGFDFNELKEISLPSSLKEIGKKAFEYNEIETIFIPSSVEKIYDYAFGHNKISTLTFGGDIKNTRGNLKYLSGFNNNLLGTIDIPFSVDELGTSAFSNNKINGSLFIPNYLKIIGESAFAWNGITELEFGSKNIIWYNYLTTIKESAFSRNELSGTISIPRSVNIIEDFAFYYNRNIYQFNLPIYDYEYDFLTLGEKWNVVYYYNNTGYEYADVKLVGF